MRHVGGILYLGRHDGPGILLGLGGLGAVQQLALSRKQLVTQGLFDGSPRVIVLLTDEHHVDHVQEQIDEYWVFLHVLLPIALDPRREHAGHGRLDRLEMRRVPRVELREREVLLRRLCEEAEDEQFQHVQRSPVRSIREENHRCKDYIDTTT